MNELITIKESNGKKAVSARDLHFALEVQTKFPDWVSRMLDYGFIEGEDFISILGESTGGRPSVDYVLSIDCAKEISMLQRTEKGKEMRKYFIECERKLQEAQQPPQSMEEMLLMSAQLLVENKKAIARMNQEVAEVKNDIIELKAKANTTDANFYSIAGYAALVGRKADFAAAASLGKKASTLSRSMGIMIGKVYDPRFGQVNTYHKDVLEEIFK